MLDKRQKTTSQYIPSRSKYISLQSLLQCVCVCSAMPGQSRPSLALPHHRNRIRNLINITSVIYVLLLEEEFTKVLASHVLYQASLSRAIAVWNHSFPGLNMWGIVQLVVEILKLISKIWENFLNTDSFSSALL